MATSRSAAYPWVFVTMLLAAWATSTAVGAVDPLILPRPWKVVSALPEMVRHGGFIRDVMATLRRVAAAILIAVAMGIPTGLYLGYRREVYRVVEGPLHALRSVPASALFPLLLLITGVGESSIILLAAYPSTLVVIVNAVTGASLANRRRLHQARLLGLRPFEIVAEVLIFEAMPSIADGVRTAISYSLVLVVAVEMFIGVGEFGLGRAIYNYQSTYRIPETYAAILIAGLLGVMLNFGLNRAERSLLVWIPERRDEQPA